jgi:hypothetical protein
MLIRIGTFNHENRIFGFGISLNVILIKINYLKITIRIIVFVEMNL